MTHPNPAFLWIVLGLPLGVALAAVFLFLTRWLQLRPRTGAESEELLLGAVSQSLLERGQLAATLGELRTVHERLLDALPFGILWVDQRQRWPPSTRAGRALLGVRPGVMGLDARFVLEPFPWLLEGLGRAPGPGLALRRRRAPLAPAPHRGARTWWARCWSSRTSPSGSRRSGAGSCGSASPSWAR